MIELDIDICGIGGDRSALNVTLLWLQAVCDTVSGYFEKRLQKTTVTIVTVILSETAKFVTVTVTHRWLKLK